MVQSVEIKVIRPASTTFKEICLFGLVVEFDASLDCPYTSIIGTLRFMYGNDVIIQFSNNLI